MTSWYIAGIAKYEFWWFKYTVTIYLKSTITRGKKFWFRGLVSVVLNKTWKRTLNGRSRQFPFKLCKQGGAKRRSNHCPTLRAVIWRGKIALETSAAKTGSKEWSFSRVGNVAKVNRIAKKKAWRGYERIWKAKVVYAASLAGLLNLNHKWAEKAGRGKARHDEAKVVN